MAPIPTRLNVLLFAALVAGHAILLFALPFAVRGDLRWIWAAIAIALTTSTLWSLIHESIHGLALRDRRMNDLLGRIACVAFGAPFCALRAGHLLHHRYSRTACEPAEVYDPARTPRWRATVGYYPWLFGGIYALEVLATFAALLPAYVLLGLKRRYEAKRSVAGLIIGAVLQPRVLRELRFDAATILVIYGFSFWLYGASSCVLIAAIAVRAFFISFADNSYHYGTALDLPRSAKNVCAPAWVRATLLNFTFHGVHHRYPALPWPALREKFAAEGLVYDEPFVRCLARQLRGPLAEPSIRKVTSPGRALATDRQGAPGP